MDTYIGKRKRSHKMSIATLEGVIEQGQIILKSNLHLPDKTKVYVVIPGLEIEKYARILSPRLAKPEQAIDFELEVIEETSDASL
jgi:hypothetical protein